MQVDLQKAFVPIGMVGEQPIAIAVNKEIPAGTVAELIGLINKTPGGMQFAATNRGGQSHLTGELFRERAKVNITFVHAQGAATSLNDVTAGRIPIMFEGLAGRPDCRAAASGCSALRPHGARQTCRTCRR
jgi:tripartite-type tricarboxylate transporter receptor subunit TctC